MWNKIRQFLRQHEQQHAVLCIEVCPLIDIDAMISVREQKPAQLLSLINHSEVVLFSLPRHRNPTDACGTPSRPQARRPYRT